jgi:integrase
MSALREALTEYVAIRRALGAQFREAGLLGHFVTALERAHAEHITTAEAVRWAQGPARAHPGTWAVRLSLVRGFAAWLSARDPRTEIPPPRLLPGRRRRPTPHIYTDQEIAQLLAAAARLPSPRGWRARTLVTLLGLLAATGLRPGEALALEVADVDLTAGVLTIRHTKFGKSRLVPITPSTQAALAAYAAQRAALRPPPQTAAFLVSERGTRLEAGTVRRTFARLSRRVGLRAATGRGTSGHGPRLQDFRHTFATRRLLEWYRAGQDVAHALPLLATYLGHSDPAHTYWYLQAIPELLQVATASALARWSGGDR